MYKIEIAGSKCGCIYLRADSPHREVLAGFIKFCDLAWEDGTVEEGQYEIAHWLINMDV